MGKLSSVTAPKQYELTTSIKVSVVLRDALRKLGSKGESYEDVIWRLVEKAEETT